MTRINAGLSPKILTDQHLMAEYRELPMVYASLRRSRKTQTDSYILWSIPTQFTLNTGHVKFFYNKLEYLEQRYELLKQELYNRNYKLDPTRIYTDKVKMFPSHFYNNWYPDKTDNEIIKNRIVEKIKLKPTWYKYNNRPIEANEYLTRLFFY
jgi:deoxyribonuclease (pyrimidine dimer)